MWREGSGWTLPYVRTSQHEWWRDVGAVNAIIQEAYGSQVRVLRCLTDANEQSERVSRKVYVLENRGAQDTHTKGEWVSREAAVSLELSHPEHRRFIDSQLEEMQTGYARYQRPPWETEGWLEPTTSWFEEQLSQLGYVQVSPIKWVYSWPLASILLAHTTTGSVYLKACSTWPLFADETRLTLHLSNLFSDRIPRPLALHPEESWMMLPDLGYPARGASITEKTEVLAAFTQLQHDSIEHVDGLLEMGCTDMRLEKLEGEIESLLAADPIQLGLEEEQLAPLKALLPRVKEMWQALSAYGVPCTLVQGEFHLGNVAVYNDRHVFFDWGQGCLSHPFFDVADFSVDEDMGPEFPENYLASWTQYETMDRLKEAWELAKSLSFVRNALVFHQAIQHMGPDPEEMRGELVMG